MRFLEDTELWSIKIGEWDVYIYSPDSLYSLDSSLFKIELYSL